MFKENFHTPLGGVMQKKRRKERLVLLVRSKKIGPTVLLSVILALTVAGCALTGGAEPTPVPGAGGETARPSVPEATPLPEEDVILYKSDGLTAAFPKEIYDQLLIFPGDADDNGVPLTVLSVYEKQSYEDSMKDYGFGAGFLFSISRHDQAQYEQFLMADGSGQEHFATDGSVYYCWNVATDVQFYRSGSTDYSNVDFTPWTTLTERMEEIRADFISRNGLTPYSDSAFFSRDFTYDGEHRYVSFVVDSYSISYMLTLSQPVRAGEDGIWCVERYLDTQYGWTSYAFGMEGTPTPQDQGIPAAEHYQSLQEAADRGERPDLLNPLEAAKTWLRESYSFLEDTLNTCAVLVEGEPGGNVWGRMADILERTDTLETLRWDGNAAGGVQRFPVPETDGGAGLYIAGYQMLSGIPWLKAETADLSGDAVRCAAGDGDQILFLDRDGLTGIQQNGVWAWFRPALEVSPYQLMRRLCREQAEKTAEQPAAR